MLGLKRGAHPCQVALTSSTQRGYESADQTSLNSAARSYQRDGPLNAVACVTAADAGLNALHCKTL